MVNNVTLMGRLTAEPELKTTNAGNSVLSFTLAVQRNFKKEETDWIDCVAWRQTAEFIANYFHKGDMIAFTGEIQTRNWEDKNGNKRKATEVIVALASFCGSKSEGKADINIKVTPEQKKALDEANNHPDTWEDANIEDLPF